MQSWVRLSSIENFFERKRKIIQIHNTSYCVKSQKVSLYFREIDSYRITHDPRHRLRTATIEKYLHYLFTRLATARDTSQAESETCKTHDVTRVRVNAHFRWTRSAPIHSHTRTETVYTPTTTPPAVFHLVSQSSCSYESRSIRRVFPIVFPHFSATCLVRIVKCHCGKNSELSMKYHTKMIRRVILMTFITFGVVHHASPTESLPSTLLGGIGNVANSATNFRKLRVFSLGELIDIERIANLQIKETLCNM